MTTGVRRMRPERLAPRPPGELAPSPSGGGATVTKVAMKSGPRGGGGAVRVASAFSRISARRACHRSSRSAKAARLAGPSPGTTRRFTRASRGSTGTGSAVVFLRHVGHAFLCASHWWAHSAQKACPHGTRAWAPTITSRQMTHSSCSSKTLFTPAAAPEETPPVRARFFGHGAAGVSGTAGAGALPPGRSRHLAASHREFFPFPGEAPAPPLRFRLVEVLNSLFQRVFQVVNG